jgi:hypothetical protein
MKTTGGFGKSGAPDFTGCSKGRYWGCEVKANTDVTALQWQNLADIEKAGGHGFVVRINEEGESGLAEFAKFLGVEL